MRESLVERLANIKERQRKIFSHFSLSFAAMKGEQYKKCLCDLSEI